MSVSTLMALSESYVNNIRHIYSIKINDIEVSQFVFGRESITITDSLKANGEDKFEPTSMNLEFNFSNDILDEGTLELSKLTFLNSYIRDLIFTDEKIRRWYFNQSNTVRNLQVKDIFKLGSELKITGTIEGIEYEIFTGIVREVKSTKKNTSFDISITAKSNIVKAYDKKFIENKVLANYYISSNLLPEKSLLHRWAKLMDFSEIEIVDVKYPDGNLIQIPYTEEIEEGNIMTEFAELVRSFNGIIKVDGDKIIVKNYNSVMFPLNVIANEKNLGQPFVVEEIDPEQKKVKVTFDQYSYGNEAVVWALKGENGTIHSANVLVPKNTPLDKQDLRWIVEWQPSGLCTSWKIKGENVKAYKVTGEAPPNSEKEYVELQYELIDITDNGGYIKFYNDRDYDIVIERFKIVGVPITKNSGNVFSFTKHEEGKISESQILEKNNKYVQTLKHVQHYAQLIYNTECEPYTQVKFKYNHCLGYMRAGTNMFIRHNLLPDMEVIVENISHNGSEAEITATTYTPFETKDNLGDIILNQGADEYDLRSEDIANNTGSMSNDKPSPPIRFSVSPGFNSLIVKLTAPNEGHIKGFNIYYRPSYQEGWNKIYSANLTTVLYDLSGKITFEVKASCVSYKELESEHTEIIVCQPREISTEDVVYPPGQSPEELEEARKKLQDVINEAIANNEREFEKIEQNFVASDGILNSTIEKKLANFNDDIVQTGMSSIKQTVDSIELRVEQTEGNISDLSDPTNLVSLINLSPEGVTIKGNVIRLNDGFVVNADGSVDVRNLQADWIIAGTLDADKVNIKNLRVDTIVGLNDKLETLNGNLMSNSGNFYDAYDWADNGGGIYILDHLGVSTLRTKPFLGGIVHEWIELKGGSTYIYSCEMASSTTITPNANTPLHYWAKLNEKAVGKDASTEIIKVSTINSSGFNTIALRITTHGTRKDTIYFRPFIYIGGGSNENYVYLKNIQIFEGLTYRDWERPDVSVEIASRVEAGSIKIGSNTVVRGRVTSLGSNNGFESISDDGRESVHMTSGGITFKRDGQNLTTIRNFEMGSAETDANGNLILNFPKMRTPRLMFSLTGYSSNVDARGVISELSKYGTNNGFKITLYGVDSAMNPSIHSNSYNASSSYSFSTWARETSINSVDVTVDVYNSKGASGGWIKTTDQDKKSSGDGAYINAMWSNAYLSYTVTYSAIVNGAVKSGTIGSGNLTMPMKMAVACKNISGIPAGVTRLGDPGSRIETYVARTARNMVFPESIVISHGMNASTTITVSYTLHRVDYRASISSSRSTDFSTSDIHGIWFGRDGYTIYRRWWDSRTYFSYRQESGAKVPLKGTIQYYAVES